MNTKMLAVVAAVACPAVLAGCGSSSPPKAAASTATAQTPKSFTDQNGYACSASQVTIYDGFRHCPEDPAASGPASPSAPPSASASQPAPAPTMTRQADKVVFKVWGSGYPSIQYGSDSDNNSARGAYGPLGDGNALPWKASLAYDPSALYYAVSAQLEGYGNIRDSVTEVITTYCSDGSHHTEIFPLASGHASGGYAIAQAEYAGGDTGNATQAESDAGC